MNNDDSDYDDEGNLTSERFSAPCVKHSFNQRSYDVKIPRKRERKTISIEVAGYITIPHSFNHRLFLGWTLEIGPRTSLQWGASRGLLCLLLQQVTWSLPTQWSRWPGPSSAKMTMMRRCSGPGMSATLGSAERRQLPPPSHKSSSLSSANIDNKKRQNA